MLRFSTASGKRLVHQDCGNGNELVVFQRMNEDSALSEIAAYEQLLLEAGYKLYQENEVSNNRFVTYINDTDMIHCNYFRAMGEFRIISGPRTWLGPAQPITDYENTVTPSVSIIGMTDNVQCMVVQLCDGSYIVIDGGWGHDANITKYMNKGTEEEIEVTYFRDAAADMESLYNFLKDNAPKGEKPRVTWMITHADPDHITLPTRFFADYADRFELETVCYNFPNFYNISLGTYGSPNNPDHFTAHARNYIDAANANFPNVKHFIYHTGQKLYLPGCEIEFLFTAGEDYWPNAMPWMNHTSGAWRITIAGATIVIPGDCERGLNDQMVTTFGDHLQSDILQLNHHGCNGATLGFYQAIDPTVCFWTSQQYHFDYDRRHRGIQPGYEFNAFLRNSPKVKANYTNTETHTVLLPSLEEK